MILFKGIKKTFAAAAVVFAAMLLGIGVQEVRADGETASNNIYIENINVAGKTEEEINQVIQYKLEQYGQGVITINVGGQATQMIAAECGLYCANTEIVSNILSIGRKGNIWQKIKMQEYLDSNEPIVYELDIQVDENAVRAVVESRCTALNIQRYDMSLLVGSDGNLYPTEKIDGLYVDVDQTTAAICDYMNNDWHGGYGEINAVTIIDPAVGDAEKYAQVTDVIGRGVTNYTQDDKNEARNVNLAVGASKIDGTIVYPGQEFSVLEVLTPFTPEAGYMAAGTYVNGEVVDDIGGGACQISSTLYRAVLEAELKVTERCEHSMVVGYVEPSMDAAVAEGVKDFKFVNDTDVPIYIQGSVGGGTVEFKIYGHETRDPARSIAFESEILEQDEQIEMRLELDPKIEFGKTKESQGHIGMKAVAHKIVYMNGEQVSKQQIAYSSYARSEQIIYLGTSGATTEQIAQLSEAVNKKDLPKAYEIIGWSPGGDNAAQGENTGTNT